MAEYAQGVQYWNDRYSQDTDTFEWFLPYGGIAGVLSQHITSISEVLVVGCGNSNLSEEIHDRLSKRVTSMDISDVVIDQMRLRCRAKQNLKWCVGDVENMDPDVFPSNRFDVVVDKGTLDSLLCGDTAEQSARNAIREVHRVLRPGGVFLCVTCGTPDSRLEHFESKDPMWRQAAPVLITKAAAAAAAVAAAAAASSGGAASTPATAQTADEVSHAQAGRAGGAHYILVMTKRSQKTVST